MLTGNHVEEILSTVSNRLNIPSSAEITLEANPGEIDPEQLDRYRQAGINRLSLGLQSFDENQLQQLGRIHGPEENSNAVSMARDTGFRNLSVDLLFRLPGQTIPELKKDLEQMVDLDPDHVSIYSLTVEPETPLHTEVHRGAIALPPEELDAEMYWVVCNFLKNAGYEHYEVSNFSKPGYRSRHNSNYWNGRHYFGLGPAAHSFNGNKRWWNISNIDGYLKRMQLGADIIEQFEKLDRFMRMEEYLLTRLRTAEGIRFAGWKEMFGESFPEVIRQFFLSLQKSRPELIFLDQDRITLTEQGWLLNDNIIEQCTELITVRSEL